MKFEHKSVMLGEVLNALDVKPNGIYLDCTLGGGGHAKAIGELLSSDGKLIGLDQDDDAISAATENLSGLSCAVKIFRENFSALDKVLDELGAMAGVSGKTYEHAAAVIESAPAPVVDAAIRP